MIHVNLLGIEVYHGEKVVANDAYLDHFKKKGKDYTHFFEDIIGMDKRYLLASEEENSLTMAVAAAEKVLDKTRTSGSDLDMIVLSSFFPEYTAPPSSIHLHQAIGGKPECICLDLNGNCAGMILSLENVTKYMSVTKNVNRALIVGSDYINSVVNPDNEFCYGHFGDAACAIILEKTNEDRGFLGAKCRINSIEHNNILFPGCGVSKMLGASQDEWLLDWKPFENVSLESAAHNMRELLEENQLTPSDVNMFCLSQYAYANIVDLRKLLEIDESHSLFIGGEYGYTGTSSPFIAFYEAIKSRKVKRDDYVMFWTIGAGSQNIAVLFRY
ncbi:3-oxoacyl-ACP synthase III family protein [Sporolactobacillus shoreicorticis]|uniref:3-oxoacyl-[acyl-carrier-protein] synthase III C-terminal domain-containing protein n=1 Tax=Sporolactobacillus shoreicorticis TaxID=1923877 RepID=A0ABW5S963_9BACL|nr:3-oxoacyl-ACP synthase III family protein [Sporolactobacillus shoreicorticis]MCO7126868.1 3-oxoacyl-ACP synthase III family protein [Sporolactobacillus shoreicorticis]